MDGSSTSASGRMNGLSTVLHRRNGTNEKVFENVSCVKQITSGYVLKIGVGGAPNPPEQLDSHARKIQEKGKNFPKD